jgi:DNA-binding NtrC family response regulator
MRKRLEALISEMLDGKILLTEALGEFEKIYIQQALERNGDHLMKTADALGIHRNTLAKRLCQYSESDRCVRLASSSRRKRPSAKLKARAARQ